MKPLLVVVLWVIALGPSTCASPVPGKKGFEEIQTLRKLNESEALRRYSTFAVDDQIDIYLLWCKIC